MKILEFGDTEKRKLVLIHGFQLPWQIWERYIEHYKNDFHIIVPVISGHDTGSREDFVSFAEDAKAIENHVSARCGKDIYAVFGMSMGGVLAATLENVIFDGSPLISLNSVLRLYMKKFYTSITHKAQQRDEKTVSQASGTIIPAEYLGEFLKVLDNMSDTTIHNAIDGIAGFRLKSGTGSSATKLHYFHGTKPNEALAKKTAGYIKKNFPGAEIHCFNGKAHCEYSLLGPEKMLPELDRILL